MNAYFIAKELCAAQGCIEMLKRAAWPAERAEAELRQAYRLSGLWRDGWTFAKAIHTSAVYIGLRATVTALRGKEQQQHGKPAPIQRAIF